MRLLASFLLMMLPFLSSMRTLAIDITQTAKCQIDLSPAVSALQAAQQAMVNLHMKFSSKRKRII